MRHRLDLCRIFSLWRYFTVNKEEIIMIVVLKRGAEQDKREQLINWLKNQGLGVHISEGEYQTVLGLVGDTSRIDMSLLESLDIVDSVKRVSDPFKCCNRKFHPDDMVVEIGDVKVGGGKGNVSSAQIDTIVALDRAEYDALEIKDSRTLYLIRG